MEKTELIRGLGRKRFGDALDEAFVHLRGGADLQLFMAMIKAMTRSGLSGLAVRLLKSGGDLLKASPELAKLMAQLEALPTGQLDPEKLTVRYEKNREALLKGRPHLAVLREQLDRAVLDVCVYEGSQKYVKALRIQAGDHFELAMPMIAKAPDLREAIGDLSQHTTSIAMMGVPRTGLWRDLLSLRSVAGFQPPFEIIEPDVELLGVWLCLIDRSEALQDERIGIFVGEQARTHYLEFLRSNPHRLLPTHFLCNTRAETEFEQLEGSMFAEIVEARNNRRQTMVRKQEIRYGARDERFMSKRFLQAGEESPPLRVGGFTTRHSTVIQYAMRDLAEAFRNHGCIFDVITEPDPYTSDIDLGGTLAESDYDLMVVINHLRFEYGDQIHPNIPFACWIQDDMPGLLTRDAGATMSDQDLVICRSSSYLAEQFGYPRECLLGSSNLTSATTYSDDPVAIEDLEPFHCDVSYVGHGWQTGQQLAAEIFPDSPEATQFLMRFLELATTRNAQKGWLNYFDRMQLVLEAQEDSGLAEMNSQQRASWLLPAAERIYDRMFRHEALLWCAEWANTHDKTFRIYGKGWENHPTLKAFASGPVQNGYEIRCLSQASAINLQLNGYDSLHQRLLDALSSGGCVISRFNPTDFSQVRFQEISLAIEKNGITSLEQLRSEAERDPVLKRTIEEAQAWSGVSLAPSSFPVRRRSVEVLGAFANFPESICSDEDWFETLRTMKSMADRVAGNIDGFDQSTFRDRDQLVEMLDRLVDDPGARRKLAEPMKLAIRLHDTHDVLVGRILNVFRQRYESLSPAQPVEA